MLDTPRSPLRRLLYISTARQMLSAAEQESVLRSSRRNNAARGITGLLITGGRRFLQVLEGPADAVATAFDIIKDDPRHFAVVVLSDQAVTDRAFPNWAMGHQAGAVDAGDRAGIAELIAPITDPTLRAYFEGFAEVHGAP